MPARKQRGMGLKELLVKASQKVKQLQEATGVKPSDLIGFMGPGGAAAATVLGALGHGRKKRRAKR